MYHHRRIPTAKANVSNTFPYAPTGKPNLDYIVGEAKLQRNPTDTIQAFTEVVRFGKMIEKGEHPDMPLGLVQELHELRLAALALRTEIYKRGNYGHLKGAVPFIERYIAMTIQYAQTQGLLPKPNPQRHRVGQIREWLRGTNLQEAH